MALVSPGLLQMKEIGERKTLAGKGNCIIKDIEREMLFPIMLTMPIKS